MVMSCVTYAIPLHRLKLCVAALGSVVFDAKHVCLIDFFFFFLRLFALLTFFFGNDRFALAYRPTGQVFKWQDHAF